MRVESFSLSHYRSLHFTSKLTLAPLTVLIGPNNEGKSNILRGFATALEALTRGVVQRERVRGSYRYTLEAEDGGYNWERDFPVELQSTDPTGASTATIEFALTDDELESFHDQVGSKLKRTLKVRLSLRRDERPAFEVLTKGPGKKILTGKQDKIAVFIRDRLAFRHIPALRTTEHIRTTIEELLSKELEAFDSSPEVAKHLEAIKALRAKYLDTLSKALTKSAQALVPEVKNIVLGGELNRTISMRSDPDLLVDDGTLTRFATKGDGIKSLITLSMLLHRSRAAAGTRTVILAIEEPESHLHPGAIHRLARILEEMSQNQQILLTTHSPQLVAREAPRTNILVSQSRAAPANNLREIRDSLGLFVSDNLTTAALVLLVEGAFDVRILHALARSKNPALRAALDSGRLAIEPTGGAGSIPGAARLYKTAMVCPVQVFVDKDAAGNGAVKAALDAGTVAVNEILQTGCPGMKESELEDLLDVKAYKNDIESYLGCSIDHPQFNSNQAKWSERIERVCKHSARPWNDSVLWACKELVAKAVEANPGTAIHAIKGQHLETLFEVLEKRLKPN